MRELKVLWRCEPALSAGDHLVRVESTHCRCSRKAIPKRYPLQAVVATGYLFLGACTLRDQSIEIRPNLTHSVNNASVLILRIARVLNKQYCLIIPS